MTVALVVECGIILKYFLSIRVMTDGKVVSIRDAVSATSMVFGS
jgi:hypothetical protein